MTPFEQLAETHALILVEDPSTGIRDTPVCRTCALIDGGFFADLYKDRPCEIGVLATEIQSLRAAVRSAFITNYLGDPLG